LLGLRIKFEHKKREWHSLPQSSWRILLGAVLFSLLWHLISAVGLRHYNSKNPVARHAAQTAVKIKLVDPSKAQKKDDLFGKRLVETKLRPTEAPKETKYLGAQDHIAEKQTRVKESMLQHDPAADAGAKKQNLKSQSAAQPSAPKPKSKSEVYTFKGPGTLSFGALERKPRNKYESLLPDREKEIVAAQEMGGGYQENIAEGELSDRVDMNTSTFKYISYFTGFRKAIELVWIYPSEAASRGMQGEVQLEIVIERTGKVSKVRVVNSSGYQVLDDSMVKTIKLASPFAPLPKGWNKERLVVTGSFRYILTYAGH
jgi:TonB family protein